MIDDPTDVLRHREEAEDATRRREIRTEQDAADLMAIADTKPGRRFLRRLLGECGYSPRLVATPRFDTNYGQMARAEGRQEIGQ